MKSMASNTFSHVLAVEEVFTPVKPTSEHIQFDVVNGSESNQQGLSTTVVLTFSRDNLIWGSEERFVP